MRIALRTGGGRGVYELAGHQGDLAASSLFDHQIFYELTPDIILPGRAVASRRSGKPRILLEDQQETTHFYRLLAAVLLLPKPKREFKTTHGTQLLGFETYSMTAIKVDVAALDSSRVVLRPTDLLLENADHLQMRIEFAQRMSRITRVWEAAEHRDSNLAELVRNLKTAILAQEPNYKTIEACAQAVLDAAGIQGDPLPTVEMQLGISEADAPAVIAPGQYTHQAEFGIADSTSPTQARLERIKQWRLAAVRGSSASNFRRDVREAYNSRCLFSGQRLPRTELTSSPGVDAAHILPWSRFDLDAVPNGLCLNKQFHWAFDEGLLRISFDEKESVYVVSIPKPVRLAAKAVQFDLKTFHAVTGPVSRTRLPRNTANWPSRQYLNELNRFLDGEVE